MELFGYSRKGFLYIINKSHLISQQVCSEEPFMVEKYHTLDEYDNYDEALWSYNQKEQLCVIEEEQQ